MTDAISTATPPPSMSPEPWWKNAPQGPPPRWASPAALERVRQQRARSESSDGGASEV